MRWFEEPGLLRVQVPPSPLQDAEKLVASTLPVKQPRIAHRQFDSDSRHNVDVAHGERGAYTSYDG